MAAKFKDPEFSAAVRALEVGSWMMIDANQKHAAYWAARSRGMKLQILLTTTGRYRMERVA